MSGFPPGGPSPQNGTWPVTVTPGPGGSGGPWLCRVPGPGATSWGPRGRSSLFLRPHPADGHPLGGPLGSPPCGAEHGPYGSVTVPGFRQLGFRLHDNKFRAYFAGNHLVSVRDISNKPVFIRPHPWTGYIQFILQGKFVQGAKSSFVGFSGICIIPSCTL